MTDIVFDNRVVIVTGAGGGLGRTYALELARRGARVVVNDLGGNVDGTGEGTSAADLVVTEINEAGGEAVANYDSVATPEGGQGIVQTALDAWGAVDVLINNAGILRDRSLAKMEPHEVDAVLDVHLRGAFNVTLPAFRTMRENNYGRIVFTSSPSGLFGNFGQANYAAAKAGLVGLSNIVAIEGAKYNVKSNAIAPVAKTRMTENLLGPITEMVEPELVTPLVVYLASEECGETHTVYSVGGGRFARVFVGVNQGWYAGQGVIPSAEDVRDNLDQINDLADYIIPTSNQEEMALLVQAFQAAGQ